MDAFLNGASLKTSKPICFSIPETAQIDSDLSRLTPWRSTHRHPSGRSTQTEPATTSYPCLHPQSVHAHILEHTQPYDPGPNPPTTRKTTHLMSPRIFFVAPVFCKTQGDEDFFYYTKGRSNNDDDNTCPPQKKDAHKLARPESRRLHFTPHILAHIKETTNSEPTLWDPKQKA